MITLVLGGNKSGKSDFGLELLGQTARPRVLLVTGRARDLAFREQIGAHRQTRDPELRVRETGTDLPGLLEECQPSGEAVLVDSLDFWVFSLLERYGRSQDSTAIQDCFFRLLSGWTGADLILVSTEMGLGPLAFDGEIRAFARDLGILNQKIARISTRVYLVLAGLAQQLK